MDNPTTNQLPRLTLHDRFSWSMTAARAAHWEQTRMKGKRRHVVLTAIFWSTWMFVVPSLRQYFSEPKPVLSDILIHNIIGGSVFGLIMGLLSWHFSESQYLNFKQKA